MEESNYSVVAIIPARAGSKGVRDKNVRLLHGYPLIAYSIKAALKSDEISRVIVSTDSEDYAELAREYGADVPFLRPAAISGDDSTDIQFFQHAIDWMEGNEGEIPDYFVHLRPTTPLRDPAVIDDAVRCFAGSSFTSLRSVHTMSESAYKAFELESGVLVRMCAAGKDLDASNFGRQQYPVTYDANGYVDVIRTSLVTEKGLLHGDHVFGYETERSYEIDEESDIAFLEYWLETNHNRVSELFCDDQ